MALVFVCEPGQEGITQANRGLGATDDLGECQNGSWVESAELIAEGLEFSVAQLDPQVLAAAFAAGFVTVGTGLLIAWAARLILHAVRRA